MKNLTTSLKTYFQTLALFPKSEKSIAIPIADIFNIGNWNDLWKIKAIVEYTEEPLSTVFPSQVLQDLGTTLYYRVGDCEDIARAQIAVGLIKNIPLYLLMVFPDTTYKNGHVMVLGLTNQKNLFVLNFTSYYVETSYQLNISDIENQSAHFVDAFSRIAYYISQDQKQWSVYWIVKLIYDSQGWLKATGYIDPIINQTSGNVEKITYKDDPQQFKDELKSLGFALNDVVNNTENNWYWIVIIVIGLIMILLIRR